MSYEADLKSPYSAKALTDALEVQAMLKGLGRVFHRANRIITGQDIKTVLTKSELGSGLDGTAGWTNGSSIFLNEGLIAKRLMAKGIDDNPLLMAVKGVNYHELAHVMFSPREQSEISQKIRHHQNEDSDSLWWWCFNVLEDLRAETLFAANYGIAVIYFSNCVLEWIIESSEDYSKLWPLLSGRKYLPPKLRRAFRAIFDKPAWRVQVARAIGGPNAVPSRLLDAVANQYIPLRFPRDTLRGVELVREFRSLCQQLVNQSGMGTPNPTGCGMPRPQSDAQHRGQTPQGAEMNKGRSTESERNTAKAHESLKDFLESLPEEEDDTESADGDTEKSGKAKAGQQAPTSEGKDTTDADGNPEGDGEESKQESGQPGTGTSKGNPDSAPTPTAAELDEMLEDLQESLASDEEVQQDLEDTLDAILAEADERGGSEPEGTYPRFTTSPVDAVSASTMRRVTRHLKELRIDMEMEVLRDQPNGHIDARRLATAAPGDLDIFTLWDEGSEEEAGTEVVLLLDQSGSMGWQMQRASAVLWTIKRSLNQVGIRTSAFGFSDGWTILAKPQDKAIASEYRVYASYGGTNPSWALREALKVLRTSTKHNLVLIVLTDGQWYETSLSTATLAEMKRLGVLTVGIRLPLGGGTATVAPVYCDQRVPLMIDMKVSAIEEVVKVVETIVANIMLKVRRAQ